MATRYEYYDLDRLLDLDSPGWTIEEVTVNVRDRRLSIKWRRNAPDDGAPHAPHGHCDGMYMKGTDTRAPVLALRMNIKAS